jgi:hypothetical protein
MNPIHRRSYLRIQILICATACLALISCNGSEKLGDPPTYRDAIPTTAPDENLDLAKAGQATGYRKAVEQFAEACDSTAKALPKVDGGYAMLVSHDDAPKLIEKHHAAYLKKGYTVFRIANNFGIDGNPDALAILPTSNKFNVIRAVGTSAPKHDITNGDIINWLRRLEQTYPLDLIGAGSSWIECKLTTRLLDPDTLARKVYKFCPDIVDDGAGSIEVLAEQIKSTQTLYLWWNR